MPSALSVRVPGWLTAVAILFVVLGITALTMKLRSPASDASAEGRGRPPIRVPLFVDPDRVAHQPRFRFTFDPPEVLAALRAEEGIDAVVAGGGDDLERFRRLTAWTREQFDPGVPDPYPPLDARIILRDVRSGFTGGFCAQYNYVLAQSLMSLGYHARYVTVQGHEVIEAWARDLRRWICLDPLNRATYVDEGGRALSVHEICVRARRGAPIIPGPESLPGTAERVRGAFGRFAVWIKNDHVSHPINFTEIDRYKVAFIFGDDEESPPPELLHTGILEDLYFDPERLRQ